MPLPDSPLKQLLKDNPPPKGAPDVPPSSPSVFSRPNPYLLEFELLNGNRVALPYTALLYLSFNPSKNIVIMFATHTVRITGVCLEPIYQSLLVEAAGTLKAVGDRPKKYSEGVPVIFSIEIKRRTGNGDDEDMPE